MAKRASATKAYTPPAPKGTAGSLANGKGGSTKAHRTNYQQNGAHQGEMMDKGGDLCGEIDKAAMR